MISGACKGIPLHFYGYILKSFYNECFWKNSEGMTSVSSMVATALSLVRLLRVDHNFPTDI